MNIGMIGIGLMGHGIASNLLKHGHRLTVLEHPGNQPLDVLLSAGAGTCHTAREVASGSALVIICVTGSPQVEAVLLGDDGVLKGLPAGATVVDCSTAVPSSTVRLADAVHAAGGRFIDAPMTRTPKEAAEGRLNLLVGGDKAVFDACLPVLQCFAENIAHVGAIGAGHQMKLLHNYVSLGSAALIAEAAACALGDGIAPEVFVDVLAKGGGGGAALERLRPYLLAGDPGGLKFAISNAYKDLGYFTQMANDSGAVHRIADAVQATFAGALEQGAANDFVPQLVSLLQGGAARAPVAGRH